MDTVILAAGRGARLRGVAAPFHKPFMVVDGHALIVSATRVALDLTRDRVIIVAAPGNVVPMIELLRDATTDVEFHDRVRFIVQPDPGGPGAALLLAAELQLSDQVMILLADNVLHESDVERALQAVTRPEVPVIGYREIPRSEPEVASRFTRILPDLTVKERIDVQSHEVWSSGFFRCWVGPLIVPTDEFVDVLSNVGSEDELKLGRHLGELTEPPILVQVESYDVGDPIVVEDL